MPVQKTILISLGGSIICPQPEKINTAFLKIFRQMILKFLKKGSRFIVIPGGGKVCRLYQSSAAKITKVSNEDKDWIGIHATRLNAHLLRTVFRGIAYPVVLDDPYKPVKNRWRLLIGSGWKPGWSTDFVAALLAKRFGIKEVVNAGNIPFVFEKDPNKHKGAKFFREISWKNYRKLISPKWTPGLSTPFDPIASKLAQKLKIRVFVIQGTDIKNFEKLLAGKKFRGTIIRP